MAIIELGFPLEYRFEFEAKTLVGRTEVTNTFKITSDLGISIETLRQVPQYLVDKLESFIAPTVEDEHALSLAKEVYEYNNTVRVLKGEYDGIHASRWKCHPYPTRADSETYRGHFMILQGEIRFVIRNYVDHMRRYRWLEEGHSKPLYSRSIRIGTVREMIEHFAKQDYTPQGARPQEMRSESVEYSARQQAGVQATQNVFQVGALF